MTAVAAATSGETRCVRPPLPCRPSKLRFDVEALRSPGASWSGFMPRHIEHPAPRHSAPASLKIWSRPSDSACSRTRPDPGTTSIRVPSATFRPASTPAAARRSSIRPLVQEPRKTVSTLTSRSGVPAVRPMYSSARSAAILSFAVVEVVRRRHVRRQRDALARVGAPGDERGDVLGAQYDLAVEGGVLVGGQALPVLDRGFPVDALRRVRLVLQVRERRLVRRDHAGLGAPLDRHVADRHPGFHRQRADRLTAVLDDVALAAAGADLRDQRRAPGPWPRRRRAVRRRR